MVILFNRSLHLLQVSTLVLMDSWINGFQGIVVACAISGVSTLVLMDSWINGSLCKQSRKPYYCFNPCFNGFMDKWTFLHNAPATYLKFQPLF